MCRLGKTALLLFCGLVAFSCDKPRIGSPLIDPSGEEVREGYVRLCLEKAPLLDQQSKAIMQGLQVSFEEGDLIDVNGFVVNYKKGDKKVALKMMLTAEVAPSKNRAPIFMWMCLPLRNTRPSILHRYSREATAISSQCSIMLPLPSGN